MSLVLFGTTAVDPVDVALVVPNDAYTPAGSTLYLADGQLITTATAPAAVAAAIDAAAGASWLTAPVATENYPTPCYIGGPNVQRVSGFTRGVVDGSQVFMRSGPGPVICPTVDVAAMVALVDATSGGGGGGGDTPTYSNGGAFSFTLVEGTGSTGSELGPPLYTRQGQSANAPETGAGDATTLYGTLELFVLDTNTLDVTLTGLPVPVYVPYGVHAVLYPVVASGSSPGVMLASATGVDAIQLTTTLPVVGDTTFFVAFALAYQADAV